MRKMEKLVCRGTDLLLSVLLLIVLGIASGVVGLLAVGARSVTTSSPSPLPRSILRSVATSVRLRRPIP